MEQKCLRNIHSSYIGIILESDIESSAFNTHLGLYDIKGKLPFSFYVSWQHVLRDSGKLFSISLFHARSSEISGMSGEFSYIPVTMVTCNKQCVIQDEMAIYFELVITDGS